MAFPPSFRRRALLSAAYAAVVWLSPASAAVSRDADPKDGTVFIRLVGDVSVLRGDDPRLRRDVLLDLSDVPVATGSGFLVSPDGLIVTNAHVVAGERRVATIAGQRVEVAVDVQRIEVVVPGHDRDPTPRRYQASVTASDDELDLAVLFIGGQDLPYVPLGDSDAIAPGESLQAIGYPFGEAIEIARPSGGVDAPPPDVSVSPGAVSAFRRDAAGLVRYVQTTAKLNPGNSGGPIVDEEGFVVAVAELELRDRTGRGVGFGIPVNVVKQFLRRHGLDQRLPARLLELGAHLDNDAKGIRMPLPDGLADHSPRRLRVDSAGSDSALALRIDRLASGSSLEQIERAFLGGEALDRLRVDGSPKRRPRAGDKGRRIDGYAKATDPRSGQELRLVYAVVDLGKERVVARYLGTPEAVATNRSVLQASLAGLELRPLLTAEIAGTLRTNWTTFATGPGGSTLIPVPAGWVVEPGGPSPCAALGEAALALAASPAGDFTVQLRASWRPGASGDLMNAARSCAPSADPSVDAAYVSSADWWGTSYQVEGLFFPGPGGVWHLEGVAPRAKSAAAGAVFKAWVAAFAAAR
ncbi:MAG: S1C family serine protease [Acidobacteriota bacterium]